LESNEGIKTVNEVFKEKIVKQIENEIDENRKEILKKALHRGIELLEGH
jgi:hypothetical protein